MGINLAGRSVKLSLSAEVERALAERATPLLAELELLFSCLIRKRVRFRDLGTEPDAVRVTDRLSVRFRPVMTQACAVSETGQSPPLEDFPIATPRVFAPRWLYIGHGRGGWAGEFGY